MRDLRLRAASLILTGVALAESLSGQQPIPKVAPLRSVERFDQRPGLRVRLTVAKSSVSAFEDPGFFVHLENVGTSWIYLNPTVASNVYIYGGDGKLVPPAMNLIAESVALTLEKADVVALRPGQRLSRPVRPEHRRANDMANLGAYTDEISNRKRLLLREGTYTARFVYVNAPGFPNEYEPRDIPEIWEGRLESDPVKFTVAAGAEAALDERQPRVPPGAEVDAPPASTPEEAERDLASDDQRRFVSAANMLRYFQSTSSFPALRGLLSHSTPWKRAAAARTMLMFDDERIRDVAMSHIDSPDESLQMLARYWLALSCTTALLPTLQQRLTPRSPDWATALGNCGDAGTFLTLRPLLDSTDPRIRQGVMSAIYLLTFEGQDGAEITWRATPADWDRWYEKHKGESRRQWAERQVRGNKRGAYFAVDYLRRTNDPDVLPVLRQAADSPDARVRVMAARGIALVDRREGVALLKRELENRAPRICSAALKALNELTDHHYAFNFHVPAERRQAIAAYAPILE